MYLTLTVRSTIDPVAMMPAIEREVRSLDPRTTISAVQTMDRVIAEANARPRFYLILLGAFAALALTLAIIGIYGVMSYTVSQRTHEIGIRMALGARRGDVLRMILRQAMLMTSAGIAIGLVGSMALAHLMKSLVYGVGPIDPPTTIGVASLLALVALAATYVPARRAIRVEPTLSLRSD